MSPTLTAGSSLWTSGRVESGLVATFRVSQGELLRAQQRLGHRDASTTLRKYAYPLPATGMGHWFAELCAETGLPGVSLRRLRHTVATFLNSRGELLRAQNDSATAIPRQLSVTMSKHCRLRIKT